MVFRRNSALLGILLTICSSAFASRAIAQSGAEAISLCNRGIFFKDSYGRLLNHFEYDEAAPASLKRHKFGAKRGCKIIAKDLQQDLSALLDAGGQATNNGLYALSCFRSLEDQTKIFCDKALERAISLEERALQSAPGGHSEHSTGLVVDFGDRKHREHNLEQEFKLTPSGKWLAAKAHKYGFELSFPNGNQQGIAYEPWHWRWVGDGKTKQSLRARNIFAEARRVFPTSKKVKYELAVREDDNRLQLSKLAANMVPRLNPKPHSKPSGLNPDFIDDDDFIRLRGDNVWQGLEIKRETFNDTKANWAIWRINNMARPDGPLWLGVHDNENAAFPALVSALKRYGGKAVFVDTGPRDTQRNARMNGTVLEGRPIDPNRYFSQGTIYTKKILRDLDFPNRTIIAVHTNSIGFNGNESECNKNSEFANGRGVISALFCDDMMRPFKSKSGRYPFDDNDSLAIIPFRHTQSHKQAFCSEQLRQRDFNIGFERVTKNTDGSLSNYALYRGIRYINLETLDRGSSPNEIKDAAARAGAMIDYVMKFCRTE